MFLAVGAKKQNKLRKQDIEKIVGAYNIRENISKYANRATHDEIIDNDYNLNIPRYVDTFEEEEPVDIAAVQKEIDNLENELTVVRKEMNDFLKELGVLI